MAKYVEQWEAAAPVPHAAHQPTAGSGRDIQRGPEWTGTVLGFDDLHTPMPPGGGPVLGQAVVALSGVRRLANTGGGPPQYAQRRVGWVAQRDRVVVIESHRRVQARPDGKFQRVGDWVPATVEILDAAKLPERTRGEVPDDSVSGKRGDVLPAGPAHAASGDRRTSAILDTGRESLTYLPYDVRLGVSQAVPAPEFNVGQATRWTDADGRLARHEVSLMAMQGQRAVVVVASMQGTSGWWQADQISYDFPRPVGEALPSVTTPDAIGR